MFVIFKTNAIGQKNRVVMTKVNENDAKEVAKKMNSRLSKGEKSYYGMKYIATNNADKYVEREYCKNCDCKFVLNTFGYCSDQCHLEFDARNEEKVEIF